MSIEAEQINAYKNLAAAVLAQAFDDLRAPERLAELHALKRTEWSKAPPKKLKEKLKAQSEAMKTANADRDRAKAFLYSSGRAADRGLWLAWLGIDESGFRKLVNAPAFQGQQNIIPLKERMFA